MCGKKQTEIPFMEGSLYHQVGVTGAQPRSGKDKKRGGREIKCKVKLVCFFPLRLRVKEDFCNCRKLDSSLNT